MEQGNGTEARKWEQGSKSKEVVAWKWSKEVKQGAGIRKWKH